VVGVAEDDLRMHLPLQFVDVNSLHGGSRAHRHEDGRFNGTVRCLDSACTGSGVRVGMLKLKSQNRN
jgi:hypothetical protein